MLFIKAVLLLVYFLSPIGFAKGDTSCVSLLCAKQKADTVYCMGVYLGKHWIIAPLECGVYYNLLKSEGKLTARMQTDKVDCTSGQVRNVVDFKPVYNFHAAMFLMKLNRAFELGNHVSTAALADQPFSQSCNIYYGSKEQDGMIAGKIASKQLVFTKCPENYGKSIVCTSTPSIKYMSAPVVCDKKLLGFTVYQGLDNVLVQSLHKLNPLVATGMQTHSIGSRIKQSYVVHTSITVLLAAQIKHTLNNIGVLFAIV